MNASVQHDSFGDLLRRYRAAAGLTQEELAERARLSARCISALERGVSRGARKDTTALLAHALGLAPDSCAAFVAAARSPGSLGLPPGSRTQYDESRPALVGRTAELAVLEGHLRGTGPPVLLICGDPGMGKSRLLQERSLRARRVGWTVLADGCQRHSGLEPYAPVLGAISSAIHGLSPT